jgi:hypothetical protein
LLRSKRSGCLVSYFFIQSDIQESLLADTILRSIIRQRLDSIQLPSKIEDALENMNTSSGLGDALILLREIIPPSKTFYIVVDGLDECEKLERGKLLGALSSLCVHHKNLRLFISSRASVRAEVQKQFDDLIHISMDCQPMRDDIALYIEGTVKEKINEGQLRVGDSSLEEVITRKLIGNAQGNSESEGM